MPPILKDILDRERNLLRQMAASDYNMYLLAQATSARPAQRLTAQPQRQAAASSSSAPQQRTRASTFTLPSSHPLAQRAIEVGVAKAAGKK